MIRQLATALALSTSLATIAVAQHDGGASSKSLTPSKEVARLDFLIGQFELTVTPKVNSLAAKIHGQPTLLGTWKTWRAVDGFGLVDELRIVDRSGNPSSLSSALRVYDANTNHWIATGVDAYKAKASSSVGEWKGSELVFQGSGVDSKGEPYLARTRYYDITPAGFTYQQDRSTDNGKTWDEGTLKITAKRVAAEASR